MRRLHILVGALTLLAFLASGAYMRFAVHPHALAPGDELLYVSRHIYMLGPALVQLVLGAYVRLIAPSWARHLQWTGSGLLVLSSLLLAAAFVVEPVAGHGRTPVSAFGLYSLFAGALLHALSPYLGRMGDTA